MLQIPYFIGLLFALTTFATVILFYVATNKSATVLLAFLLVMLVQAVMAQTGYFLHTQELPPRFILLAPPVLVVLFALFFTQNGKLFIDGINLKTLTLLHIIRIPVEVVLWLLFVHKTIPDIMTFEGRNFDIFSGITAPIIYLMAFKNGTINKKLLLGWNIVCLLLLINVLVNAVLSIQTPFQQFAFNQPNIAVMHFPYIWLPGVVVPIVLFSHFVAFRRLSLGESTT